MRKIYLLSGWILAQRSKVHTVGSKQQDGEKSRNKGIADYKGTFEQSSLEMYLVVKGL